MHLRLYIFDLDGTLIDSALDISLCVNRVMRELKREEVEPERIKNLIGGGARKLLEALLPEEEVEEGIKLFRRFYMENPVIYTKLYDGMEEVIKTLKSKCFYLAVVTNKMEELSIEILKRLNVLEYFDAVVGGDTYPEKKPSPVPVLGVLERLRVEPEKALMVGDTDADITAGSLAGTWTALASWGYVKLENTQPNFIFSSPKEILSLNDII